MQQLPERLLEYCLESGIEGQLDSFPHHFEADSSTVGVNSPHVAGVAGESLQTNLSGVARRRDDVYNFRSRAIQRVTTLDQLVPGSFQ